ncbi:disintegrin and metalloproteinase domain-containing protein 10 [Aplochiton taeniatus]
MWALVAIAIHHALLSALIHILPQLSPSKLLKLKPDEVSSGMSWGMPHSTVGKHAGAVSGISPFIKYYEELSYDREALHRQHQRLKRDSQPHEQTLLLDFNAFHRTFRMRLRRDATMFSENFVLVTENNPSTTDLSHLFSGELQGDQGSQCHGSVVEGQFEGSIHAANGTFYVEPAHRYNHSLPHHHSIIYHQDDIDHPLASNHNGFCGTDHLQHLAQTFNPIEDVPVSQASKTIDESKTSCLLHLHADHLYFKKFKSVEKVVAQVAAYIRVVNDIYNRIDFEGIKLVNFRVKSLTVLVQEDKGDPIQRRFSGPEMLLSLYSEANWGNYCLSYLLTDRDYQGVLGLAYVGMNGNAGGICSKYMVDRANGRNTTHNTGLITLQNYGHYLPPWLVHLTLAHELGHSLGALHDEADNCGDLGSSNGKGRFLMFPEATNEVRENNYKLSPCTITSISKLLRTKKDSCFIVSDQPICGNLIVEAGEECDIGHNQTDLCCYSAQKPGELQCRLKPGQRCSLSQGLCCEQGCVFKPQGVRCDEETDCEMESVCSGLTPVCPAPTPKANLTTCGLGTRVCFNGHCTKSLCVKHGLEQCDCIGESTKEKCHMCCQQPGRPETCASTTSSVLSSQFKGKRVSLVAGAPCSGKQGFCDQFQVCRLLDADGPIARLKNAYLHLNDFDDMGDWMKAHWWAILLAIMAVSSVMGGIITLCNKDLGTQKTGI